MCAEVVNVSIWNGFYRSNDAINQLFSTATRADIRVLTGHVDDYLANGSQGVVPSCLT